MVEPLTYLALTLIHTHTGCQKTEHISMSNKIVSHILLLVNTMKLRAVFNTQNEFEAVCNGDSQKYQQLVISIYVENE